MFSSLPLSCITLIFRRIQESATVQSACRDEIAPFLIAVGEVEAGIGRAERAVGTVDTAMRRCNAETGTRGSLDHNAGLATEFGRRRPGNNFQ